MTESETAGLIQTVQPVEMFVFEGFRQNLSRVLGVPIVWTTSSAQSKIVQTMLGGSLSYPYGALTLQSGGVNKDSYNAKVLATRGKVCTITTDQKRFYRVHILPSNFSAEFKMWTNDFAHILKAFNSWSFASVLGWTKFEIQYGGVNFGVSVELNQDVTFPSRDDSPDSVQEYELSALVTIHGFISYAVLTEGQAADNIAWSTLMQTNNQGDRVELWAVNSRDLLSTPEVQSAAPTVTFDHQSDGAR